MNPSKLKLIWNETTHQYESEDGNTMKREPGLNNLWVLRTKYGLIIGADAFRHDLAERKGYEIKHPDGEVP